MYFIYNCLLVVYTDSLVINVSFAYAELLIMVMIRLGVTFPGMCDHLYS